MRRKKNKMGTGAALFLTLSVMVLIGCFIPRSEPECVMAGCNHTCTSNSNYCILHDFSYKTYGNPDYNAVYEESRQKRKMSNYTSPASNAGTESNNSGVETNAGTTNSNKSNEWNTYDPYDVYKYDNPDDFADDWAEEFCDGDYEEDYDEGYDEAYDYWGYKME